MVGAAVAGSELAQRESDLREALLDTIALMRSGITLNQLRDRIPDLTIKFDRYARSGGEAQGSLYKVVDNIRGLESNWTEGVGYEVRAADFLPADRMKISRRVSEGRQRHFKYVIESIAKYEEERKAAIEAIQAKQKGSQ